MSLISLLIAVALERSLSSTAWGFQRYFQWYKNFFGQNIAVDDKPSKRVTFTSIAFIVIPVIIVAAILSMIDNGLIHVALSTIILIVCFGCAETRASYKLYLSSAYRGEETTTELHHQQLLSDKNLPQMGFGQALVWLNYRYYVAVTLFFILFGAAGAVFYRLLTSVIEQQNKACQAHLAKQAEENTTEEETVATNDLDRRDTESVSPEEAADENQPEETERMSPTSMDEEAAQARFQEDKVVPKQTMHEQTMDEARAQPQAAEQTQEVHESIVTPTIASGCNNHHDILFWVDWLPVRVTSFGYMFVGHFSKAMPVWLENCFDFNKPTHQVLIDVAEKSEDIMVDAKDCTSEPCLLVRLAKRNALFILAVIAILTLTGVLV